MSNNVKTLHPDYSLVKGRWQLVRAIVNNQAKEFIRKPDANDHIRNTQYREDAILTNFTNLTKVGLTGLVFRKNPLIALPPAIDYIEDDATSSGINLLQFSQHSVAEALQVGRYGFLVDFDAKAYIKPYTAESIINWKTRDVNGECLLSLVVLAEEVLIDEDDIFSQDTRTQYRVLRLDENNIYIQEVYDTDNNVTDYIVPVDFNGNVFNFIPFVFVGSENNDSRIDYQPLYDLAIVNLGHYRNSADYEESIFITGQPYLVVNVGDGSATDFLAANPNGCAYGSRKALVLASGGQAYLLQASANQLVAQAMKEKIEQAAAIGARLISPAGGRETAEAAKIRYGSQHSALYTIVSNVQDAVELALSYICMFMGANPDDVEFELNDEFYDDVADANVLAQMILMSDRGIVALDDIRDYGRRTGLLASDRSNEDIEADAEMIDPLAGAINDNTGRDFKTSDVVNASSEDSGQDN